MQNKPEKDEKKEQTSVVDFEANTIEEAIKKALRELKLPKEKIIIKILSEGQRGLFGMQGAKKAKIRVTILKDEQKTS